MNPYFIGREKELGILNEAMKSGQSEMIAIIGRRRVGKTHLVKQAFKDHFDFVITGLQHTPNQLQLENFANKLNEYSKPKFPIKSPANWLEAFNLLKIYLSSKKKKEKKALFFDELPWMVNPKSGFLEALGHFWNDWATSNNVILIICGSAASWMIRQVIHHKGSLHNRITKLIHLQPFTLAETARFLSSNGIQLNNYDIIQMYMVMGGIPHYLKEIKKGESVSQNIERIFFQKSGLLYDEFDKLYNSLFDHPHNHISVIKGLASRWVGLTRADLVAITKISDGGAFTRIIIELEQSDFITAIPPFGKKKKDLLYRLTDNYSLFYLKFMQNRKRTSEGSLSYLSNSPVWKSWCGYAFENICFNHLLQIKSALGITGVYTEVSSFLSRGEKDRPGTQIDLLINRADNIVNVCEIKFAGAPFIITKKYAEELRIKRETIRQATNFQRTVFITFITSFGIQQNAYALELVQNQVIATDLFFK